MTSPKIGPIAAATLLCEVGDPYRPNGEIIAIYRWRPSDWQRLRKGSDGQLRSN